MKEATKISKKAWIVIGVLVAIIVIILFMIITKMGNKNNYSPNSQINKSNNIVSNSTIQNRQFDSRLPIMDEKKKLEEQIKNNNFQKFAEDQKGNSGNWFSTVKGLFSEYGVQFMALVVSLIGVILAISGFSLSGKKKQKFLKKYFHEIDDAYGAFKMKSNRCEAELLRLQDLIEHDLKEGKIDESTFHLLEKRIERYLKEIKEQEKA